MVCRRFNRGQSILEQSSTENEYFSETAYPDRLILIVTIAAYLNMLSSKVYVPPSVLKGLLQIGYPSRYSQYKACQIGYSPRPR